MLKIRFSFFFKPLEAIAPPVPPPD